MTRDYKKHGGKKSSSNSGWLWFAGGLGLGLVLSLAIYITDRSTIKNLQQQLTAPTPAEQLAKTLDDLSKAPVVDNAELEPRFTFYDELPKFEVTVPAAAKSTTSDDRPTGSAANIDIDNIQSAYILQAGSFQSLTDAEQLKAQLAMLGMRANIESATAQDQQTWHRVRLGPYSSLPEAHDAQAMLIDQELDTLIMQMPTRNSVNPL